MNNTTYFLSMDPRTLSELVRLSTRDLHIIAHPWLVNSVLVNGKSYPILSFVNETMRVAVDGKAEVFREDVCLTNQNLIMEPGTFAELDHCC